MATIWSNDDVKSRRKHLTFGLFCQIYFINLSSLARFLITGEMRCQSQQRQFRKPRIQVANRSWSLCKISLQRYCLKLNFFPTFCVLLSPTLRLPAVPRQQYPRYSGFSRLLKPAVLVQREGILGLRHDLLWLPCGELCSRRTIKVKLIQLQSLLSKCTEQFVQTFRKDNFWLLHFYKRLKLITDKQTNPKKSIFIRLN